MKNLSAKISQFFLTLMFAVISLNMGSSATPSKVSNIENDITALNEIINHYGTQVRVFNRTDYRVKIYIDGFYLGKVYGDDYEYFKITPGYHRVIVQWSSGYYEWYDFYVGSGGTHKIWTSDY